MFRKFLIDEGPCTLF